MGNALILKEIRNHLLSFRFLAVFILLLVIVPATVMILTNDTVRKQDEFSRRRADIENYLGQYAHFNRLGGIIAPSRVIVGERLHLGQQLRHLILDEGGVQRPGRAAGPQGLRQRHLARKARAHAR